MLMPVTVIQITIPLARLPDPRLLTKVCMGILAAGVLSSVFIPLSHILLCYRRFIFCMTTRQVKIEYGLKWIVNDPCRKMCVDLQIQNLGVYATDLKIIHLTHTYTHTCSKLNKFSIRVFYLVRQTEDLYFVFI